MRNCHNCGHRNSRRAIYCGRCGGVLAQTRPAEEDKLSVLAGPSAAPAPKEDLYQRGATRARHFLLMLVCLLAVPVGLLISGWSQQTVLEGGHLAARPLLPMLGLPCILYLCVLYSYMVAKTGEACGFGFGKNFMIGCIPVLTPFVWAGFCGRSRLRPYYWLLADAALIGGGFMLLKEYPALLTLLIIFIMPFIVSHILGCSVTQIAHLIGLIPSMTVLWLCLGPSLLLGVLTFDFMRTMEIHHLHQTVMLTKQEINIFIKPEMIIGDSLFSIAFIVFILTTFAAWIKLVYDNLRVAV